MAFTKEKINDLRRILLFVFVSLPAIATTNIDCNGKPFHCINSTHFMICVDLGGGLSSTIDNYIIPCPPTTVCQGTNRFECEFPRTTIAPLPQYTDSIKQIVKNEAPSSKYNSVITTTAPKTTSGELLEEYFNTVSMTTLSEDRVIGFTTQKPTTLSEYKNSLQEEEKHMQVTNYTEIGLESVTNMSNITASVVNANSSSLSHVENDNVDVNANAVLNKSASEIPTVNSFKENILKTTINDVATEVTTVGLQIKEISPTTIYYNTMNNKPILYETITEAINATNENLLINNIQPTLSNQSSLNNSTKEHEIVTEISDLNITKDLVNAYEVGNLGHIMENPVEGKPVYNEKVIFNEPTTTLQGTYNNTNKQLKAVNNNFTTEKDIVFDRGTTTFESLIKTNDLPIYKQEHNILKHTTTTSSTETTTSNPLSESSAIEKVTFSRFSTFSLPLPSTVASTDNNNILSLDVSTIKQNMDEINRFKNDINIIGTDVTIPTSFETTNLPDVSNNNNLSITNEKLDTTTQSYSKATLQSTFSTSSPTSFARTEAVSVNVSAAKNNTRSYFTTFSTLLPLYIASTETSNILTSDALSIMKQNTEEPNNILQNSSNIVNNDFIKQTELSKFSVVTTENILATDNMIVTQQNMIPLNNTNILITTKTLQNDSVNANNNVTVPEIPEFSTLSPTTFATTKTSIISPTDTFTSANTDPIIKMATNNVSELNNTEITNLPPLSTLVLGSVVTTETANALTSNSLIIINDTTEESIKILKNGSNMVNTDFATPTKLLTFSPTSPLPMETTENIISADSIATTNQNMIQMNNTNIVIPTTTLQNYSVNANENSTTINTFPTFATTYKLNSQSEAIPTSPSLSSVTTQNIFFTNRIPTTNENTIKTTITNPTITLDNYSASTNKNITEPEKPSLHHLVLAATKLSNTDAYTSVNMDQTAYSITNMSGIVSDEHNITESNSTVRATLLTVLLATTESANKLSLNTFSTTEEPIKITPEDFFKDGTQIAHQDSVQKNNTTPTTTKTHENNSAIANKNIIASETSLYPSLSETSNILPKEDFTSINQTDQVATTMSSIFSSRSEQNIMESNLKSFLPVHFETTETPDITSIDKSATSSQSMYEQYIYQNSTTSSYENVTITSFLSSSSETNKTVMKVTELPLLMNTKDNVSTTAAETDATITLPDYYSTFENAMANDVNKFNVIDDNTYIMHAYGKQDTNITMEPNQVISAVSTPYFEDTVTTEKISIVAKSTTHQILNAMTDFSNQSENTVVPPSSIGNDINSMLKPSENNESAQNVKNINVRSKPYSEFTSNPSENLPLTVTQPGILKDKLSLYTKENIPQTVPALAENITPKIVTFGSIQKENPNKLQANVEETLSFKNKETEVFKDITNRNLTTKNITFYVSNAIRKTLDNNTSKMSQQTIATMQFKDNFNHTSTTQALNMTTEANSSTSFSKAPNMSKAIVFPDKVISENSSFYERENSFNIQNITYTTVATESTYEGPLIENVTLALISNKSVTNNVLQGKLNTLNAENSTMVTTPVFLVKTTDSASPVPDTKLKTVTSTMLHINTTVIWNEGTLIDYINSKDSKTKQTRNNFTVSQIEGNKNETTTRLPVTDFITEHPSSTVSSPDKNDVNKVNESSVLPQNPTYTTRTIITVEKSTINTRPTNIPEVQYSNHDIFDTTSKMHFTENNFVTAEENKSFPVEHTTKPFLKESTVSPTVPLLPNLNVINQSPYENSTLYLWTKGTNTLPFNTNQFLNAKDKTVTTVYTINGNNASTMAPYSAVPTNILKQNNQSITLTMNIEANRIINKTVGERNYSYNTKIALQTSTVRLTLDSIKTNNTNNRHTNGETTTFNTNYIPKNKTHSAKSHFVCPSHRRGRYADNENCRKFYICIGKHNPIIGRCPIDTVFSEIRKQCTKNLSHCIRNNQFYCSTEGRFSDFLRDNIYYICVNTTMDAFVRFKLQCLNGYHLNKTSVRCELNEEISDSSNSDSNSKNNSDQSTAKMKYRNHGALKTDIECKEEGKFADPNDCRKYYVCSKSNKYEFRRKIKKCESDEIFHNDKKKCVEADSFERK